MEDAYWELVITDIIDALAVLRPVFDASGGTDGFVSVEVAPELARDTPATIAAARRLHARIDEPNLFVKIPATAEGVPAIQAMIAEGRSINITLIFSLTRYAEVIDAYLSGLETFTAAGGDPSTVHSVASFFVSRVDTEVDRRLEAIGGRRRRRHCAAAPPSPRRSSPTSCSGAVHRRTLGASGRPRRAPSSDRCGPRHRPRTRAYPDTLYVDSLIGPDTVNTLPEATIADFEDHGTLARTIDVDVDEARRHDASPRRASASTWTTLASASNARVSLPSTTLSTICSSPFTNEPASSPGASPDQSAHAGTEPAFASAGVEPATFAFRPRRRVHCTLGARHLGGKLHRGLPPENSSRPRRWRRRSARWCRSSTKDTARKAPRPANQATTDDTAKAVAKSTTVRAISAKTATPLLVHVWSSLRKRLHSDGSS